MICCSCRASSFSCHPAAQPCLHDMQARQPGLPCVPGGLLQVLARLATYDALTAGDSIAVLDRGGKPEKLTAASDHKVTP